MSSYELIASTAVNSWSLQEQTGLYLDSRSSENLEALGGPNRDALGPTWWLPRAVRMVGAVSLRRNGYVGSSGIIGMTVCGWLRREVITASFASLYSYGSVNLGIRGSISGYAVYDGATFQQVVFDWLDFDWHFCAWTRSVSGSLFSFLRDDFFGSVPTTANFPSVAQLNVSMAGQELACDVAGVMAFNYPLTFAMLQVLRGGPAGVPARPRLRGSGKIRKIRR